MAKKLMKGCVAVAEAAIRGGCRFFAGYPITPQSDIPEYLSAHLPDVGGTFIQGESEVASINMLLHRRQTEIRHLNGAIADYGDRLGVSSPLNRMLTELVSCEQENYDAVYVKKP